MNMCECAYTHHTYTAYRGQVCCIASRQALLPHLASCSLDTEDISLGLTWPGWEMKLTTHPSQVLRLRMRGAVPPLFQVPSWYAQVKLVI